MSDVRTSTDLEYAVVDGHSLLLDLYRPAGGGPVPVVLYLHGGAWAVGDKAAEADARLVGLAGHGIAVASANYRLTDRATFPSPVHDAKAAVRWLRANGERFGLSTSRIGVWGASAGAVLANLVALTAGDPELEGVVGGHLDVSSAVQAAVSWFGQSDLVGNARRSGLEEQILAPPAENNLFGGPVSTDADRARSASPLTRVHPEAPPFLVVHGDHDRVTPEAESRALHDALVRAGASSTFTVLGGAGHEGAEFDAPAHLAITAAFLSAQLDGAT